MKCKAIINFYAALYLVSLTMVFCVRLRAKKTKSGKQSSITYPSGPNGAYTEASEHGDEHGVPQQNRDLLQNALTGSKIPHMKRYMPRNKDLRRKKLFKLLGKHYNKDWMSAKGPTSNETPTTSRVNSNDAYIDQTVKSDTTLGQLNNETLMIIQKWLSEHTFCPVEFKWKDLGPLFWPRYVKEGSCKSKRACSFNSGMRCVPGDTKHIHILRWRCKIIKKIVIGEKAVCITEMNRSRRNFGCKWKLIPFQILDSCICSC